MHPADAECFFLGGRSGLVDNDTIEGLDLGRVDCVTKNAINACISVSLTILLKALSSFPSRSVRLVLHTTSFSLPSSPLQVAFFLFLSLTVYTVLPLSLTWALVFGLGTSASHIIIISVYVPVTSPKMPDLAPQVRHVELRTRTSAHPWD